MNAFLEIKEPYSSKSNKLEQDGIDATCTFFKLRDIKRMNIIAPFRQDSFINGNWNEYLLQIIYHQDCKQESKRFVIL